MPKKQKKKTKTAAQKKRGKERLVTSDVQTETSIETKSSFMSQDIAATSLLSRKVLKERMASRMQEKSLSRLSAGARKDLICKTNRITSEDYDKMVTAAQSIKPEDVGMLQELASGLSAKGKGKTLMKSPSEATNRALKEPLAEQVTNWESIDESTSVPDTDVDWDALKDALKDAGSSVLDEL